MEKQQIKNFISDAEDLVRIAKWQLQAIDKTEIEEIDNEIEKDFIGLMEIYNSLHELWFRINNIDGL